MTPARPELPPHVKEGRNEAVGRAVATGAAGAAMAVPHFSRQVFNKVKGHLADRGNFAHVACALVEDIGDLAVSTDAFCLPFSVLR